MRTDATLAFRNGQRQRGLAWAGLGTATIGAWFVWGLTGPLVRPGMALPEIVGAVAFAAWVVGVSVTA